MIFLTFNFFAFIMNEPLLICKCCKCCKCHLSVDDIEVSIKNDRIKRFYERLEEIAKLNSYEYEILGQEPYELNKDYTLFKIRISRDRDVVNNQLLDFCYDIDCE